MMTFTNDVKAWWILSLQGFVSIICVWITLLLWSAAGSEAARMQSRPEHFLDDAVATLMYFAVYLLACKIIPRRHPSRELLAVLVSVCAFGVILGLGIIFQAGRVSDVMRAQFLSSSIRQILLWSTIEGTALLLGLVAAVQLRKAHAI